MEREINPRFNSFDSAEGSVAETTRKSKWIPEVKKLVSQNKAPRMAELIGIGRGETGDVDGHLHQLLLEQRYATGLGQGRFE